LKTFTDGKNQWSIDINVGSIKRVLATTGVNLSLPHEPDAEGQTLADRLIRDTIFQVDVIWALLEAQATTLIILSDEESKVTPDAQRELRLMRFCDLFKPEIMKSAEAALLEEWKDFFQKLGRTAVATAIEQTQTLQLEMQTEGVKQLGRLQGAQANVMRKALTDQVDQVLKMAESATNGPSSESATESPEGSESDPAKSTKQLSES